MKIGYKYGLVLGNKAKDGIRVQIVISKESTMAEPKTITKEECEQFLRQVGKYLRFEADFKTLTRLG